MGDAGTRDRLLEAAIDLFAANGFRGVSVRDVAREASVNVAGVNYYFGSKEKLWEEAYAAASARAVLIAQAAVVPGAPARDNVANVMGALFDQLSADDRPLRMSGWASLTRDDQLAQSASLLRPLLVMFKALVAAESSGRRDLDLDLCSVYAIFAQTMLWRGVHREILGHQDDDDIFLPRLRAYIIDQTLELVGLGPNAPR